MTRDMSEQPNVYVSITGLQLRSVWYFPRFIWLSMRALRQARATDGNISAELNTIEGVYHTLTVWHSKEAMRRFAYSGVHQRAISVFPSIATGKVFGYEAEHVPDWREARELWQKHGREVMPAQN